MKYKILFALVVIGPLLMTGCKASKPADTGELSSASKSVVTTDSVQDAANGVALCYDDTSVKIMSEIKPAKTAQKGEKSQHTCYTTGIVSLHEDHRTYLYITDNRTAGKCIADIMMMRDAKLDLPIMMCDALSANIPQGIADDLYVLCFCQLRAIGVIQCCSK
jgi:hypothetical protein